MPPLSKIDQERLVAAVRQRIEEAQLRCREEIDDALDDLRSALLTDTSIVDTMAIASRGHRVAMSASHSPNDKITPILQAKNLSAAMLAKKAKINPSQFTRYRTGERQIPADVAARLQSSTISALYPKGIEPTKAFWPAGIKGE